jgi:iron complex outermembrane receptor protein
MRLALIRPVVMIVLLLGASGARAQRPLDVLHTPVTEAVEARDLEITANVRRYREIRGLLARYRRSGALVYRSLELKRTAGDFFEARIPGAEVKPPALEYYLEVLDREGKILPAFASAAGPQVVKVHPTGKEVVPRTALEEELAVFKEGEVFSAARQRQRIEESPSAITVITSEDIRNYGATSIAEVLRTVPGMDYMQISAADPNLSVRGFNRELSNRILTLIDGRSAYVDVFGMTFWEVLPISLWDIDRIEVIRGPGSTLYGANAFGGVVNIYTKSPEQAQGMHVYLQGGAHGFNSTLLAGGKAGKHTGYRISVTHDQIASFDRVTRDDKLGVRGNALVQFELPDGARLALRGGLVRQFFGPTFSLNGPFSTEVTLGYGQLNFDYKALRFQVWYTGIKADLQRSFPIPRTLSVPGGPVLPITDLLGEVRIGSIPNARPDTIDAELTYTVEPTRLLRMTFGLNYRFNQFDIPALLEPRKRQNLLGAFGQFEIRPHETLSINLGARFDLLAFSDDSCPQARVAECLAGQIAKVPVDNLLNFSPRGALVWGFHPNQTLRLSGGIAFRNPAFVENLIRYQVADPGTLGRLLGGGPRPALIFAGNEALGSEQLRSAEIGYGVSLLGNRLRLNLDLFYLEGLDLILLQPVDLLAAFTGARAISTYRNLLDARNYGFELSIRATFTDGIKAFVNYSYQKVEIKNRADLIRRIAAGEFGRIGSLEDLTTLDSESPMNKLNFGINVAHAKTGLFINLYGHFVGFSRRRNGFTAIPETPVPLLGNLPLGVLTGARSLQNIDAYFLLNANFGYRLLGGQLEVGVAGFNLLGAYDTLRGDGFDPVTGQLQDRRHIEYPRLSMQGQVFGGEAIGARVYAFVRGYFR